LPPFVIAQHRETGRRHRAMRAAPRPAHDDAPSARADNAIFGAKRISARAAVPASRRIRGPSPSFPPPASDAGSQPRQRKVYSSFVLNFKPERALNLQLLFCPCKKAILVPFHRFR
jgi:hypothetical protein